MMLERAVSKLLALLVLCLLAAPVILAANIGLSSLTEKREELEDARLKLTRLQNASSITIDPALPEKIATQLAEYKAKPASRGTLVANLQERLRGLAEQAQVEIVQMSEQASTEDSAPYEKITLRLQLSGIAANMVQFFTLVEAGKPLLLSDNLALRSSPIIAANAQTEQPLEAEFDITGFADKAATP